MQISEAKGDWDFRNSDLVKTLIELIFNPCGEIRCSPEGPVSQIHSPHLHAGAPGIFSDLLKLLQMLKKEWGAKSNGKLSIPSKTPTWVPEFAVEDLPLSRTAFAVKGVPLGRILWRWCKFQNVQCALGFELKHSTFFCWSFREWILILFLVFTINKLFWPYSTTISSSSERSAQGQVLRYKLRNQGHSYAQRQVFHRKLRNPHCKFY